MAINDEEDRMAMRQNNLKEGAIARPHEDGLEFSESELEEMKRELVTELIEANIGMNYDQAKRAASIAIEAIKNPD